MSTNRLSTRVKNILILIGFVITAIFAYYLSAVIAPFLISVVLAYVLNPIIRYLVSKKVPRPWAVLTVFVIGLTVFTLFIVPLSFSFIAEASEMLTKLGSLNVNLLANNLKDISLDFYEKTNSIPYLNNYIKEFVNGDRLRELAANSVIWIKDGALAAFKRTMGFMGSAFAGMMNMFLIPILVFYVLLDMDEIFNSFKMLIPPDYRARTLDIFSKIDTQLSTLLRGQLFANTLFAIAMTFGLWLSGLNFFLFLGPLAGLANFIPYLGGLFTVILAFFIAIAQFGFSKALLYLLLKVVLVIGIIQTIDAYYMQPYVVGENAGLHPLIVMLALAIAANLAGIPGMLLAAPMAITLKVLGKELYHELYDQEET